MENDLDLQNETPRGDKRGFWKMNDSSQTNTRELWDARIDRAVSGLLSGPLGENYVISNAVSCKMYRYVSLHFLQVAWVSVRPKEPVRKTVFHSVKNILKLESPFSKVVSTPCFLVTSAGVWYL